LHIDQDVFSELIDLVPIIQDTALECLEKELTLHRHDRSRMFTEREGFMRFFRLLQRKWALDVIYVLLIQGELHFNELRRVLEGVSSRTLTDRLSELGERGIVSRAVRQDKPVKVMYSLTDYGRGLAALFVPVLFYGLSNQKQ
jgi:DNA-binding HxlR family transcriptional regulator